MPKNLRVFRHLVGAARSARFRRFSEENRRDTVIFPGTGPGKIKSKRKKPAGAVFLGIQAYCAGAGNWTACRFQQSSIRKLPVRLKAALTVISGPTPKRWSITPESRLPRMPPIPLV